MTIIAGMISRTGKPLPASRREALISNLSRDPRNVVEAFGAEQWLLAKIDIGAFRCKGSFANPDGPVMILAGEPLLLGGDRHCQDRQAEGQALFQGLCDDSVSTLSAVTGVFCAAFYAPQQHKLTLISDKLGARPIYYLATSELVAFTSALRVFEAMGLASGGIDLRGTYDMCAFGFPLGDRTCYRGVRTIEPGAVITFTSVAETHTRYFRWDRLQAAPDDEESLIQELAVRFDDAVLRRLRRDSITVSLLSGGLDSRAIVAALRKHNTTVLTVNFAPPPANTQDRVFAAQISRALGAVHQQLDVRVSSTDSAYRMEHVRRWLDSTGGPAEKVDRPLCIWSGDGGSVGLGHVYLDEETVRLFEKGDSEAGIQAFLRYNRITGASNRGMTAAFREQTRDWHLEGMREEIYSLERRDGRAPHLFLMLNDQRRHLARHFENIDIERTELHTPFYDSRFLEMILAAPIWPFLRHRLYHKWLNVLSPVACSVPWQAYPNHEPCPLPIDEQLRYQWNDDYLGGAEDRRLARKQAREALRRLFKPCFPHHLINRAIYSAAILLSLLGSTSYRHVMRVGDVFAQSWQKSRG